MIRINLLPRTKRAARTSSAGSGSTQAWAGAYMVAAVLTGVVGAILYFGIDAELQEQVAQNNALEARIQEKRQQSALLEEVQAKLDQSMALEEVVAELGRARTGPTRAMMELSRILSTGEGSGPTIDPQALEALRRENSFATFNRSWDARRLWLNRFEEEGRQCRIAGVGRTNEDVAEFLRRLQLSELFDQVTLQRTQSETDTESGLELIGFELTCQVTY